MIKVPVVITSPSLAGLISVLVGETVTAVGPDASGNYSVGTTVGTDEYRVTLHSSRIGKDWSYADPATENVVLAGQSAGANPKQLYGDKKVPLQNVPPAALIYLGAAMSEGARKYGAYNWRTTKVEALTYLGAALRHILQVLDGADIDPETGDAKVPHVAAAMACLAIYADAKEGGFMIDNRPPAGPASRLLTEYKKK